MTEGQTTGAEGACGHCTASKPGENELDLEILFGNDQPVIMEIGFGNGDATWQMALNEPDRNFLGVEVHKPGVGHLLLKIEEHRISNLRIACEDAVELLRKRIPDRALSGSGSISRTHGPRSDTTNAVSSSHLSLTCWPVK